MMAKLGSFDDLPPNAQGVLLSYRARLEGMSEAESKVVAVREVYASYYGEMGGLGTAPELEAPVTPAARGAVRSQTSRKPPPARLAAAAPGAPAGRFNSWKRVGGDQSHQGSEDQQRRYDSGQPARRERPRPAEPAEAYAMSETVRRL